MGYISYNKLRRKLDALGVTSYVARRKWGLSAETWASIQRGKPIALQTVAVLCEHLGCQPGDILDYVEGEDHV